MLTEPTMEQMLPKAGCAYELAVLVSKRASQLVEGAQPMIDQPAANMVSLACKEIAEGKVVGVKGTLKKGEYALPLTKEAREAQAAERKAKESQEAYRRYAQETDPVMLEEEISTVDSDDIISEEEAEYSEEYEEEYTEEFESSDEEA